MFDERADAAFVLEHVVLVVALVVELDLDARIEERQLAQSLGEDVVMEFGVGEDRRARMEAHRSSTAARRSHNLKWITRLAEGVFLAVFETVAINRQRQMIG